MLNLDWELLVWVILLFHLYWEDNMSTMSTCDILGSYILSFMVLLNQRLTFQVFDCDNNGFIIFSILKFVIFYVLGCKSWIYFGFTFSYTFPTQKWRWFRLSIIGLQEYSNITRPKWRFVSKVQAWTILWSLWNVKLHVWISLQVYLMNKLVLIFVKLNIFLLNIVLIKP